MPRWKDDEDRGEFGAWLSAQVGERTFDWLAAEMAKRGHAHRPDYYRAMAGGSKPPGRIIGRALREFFGGGPEPRRSPSDPVAAAIDRQTDVLNDLVAELRLERAQRDVSLDQMARLLGGLSVAFGIPLPDGLEGTPGEGEHEDAADTRDPVRV